MVSVTIGEYTLRLTYDALPDVYAAYRSHAHLADELALDAPGPKCFVAVERAGSGWPSLVIAQQYEHAHCFHPGALLVPETHTLFLGAGTRLLTYRLGEPRRLWEDSAEMGVLGWRRFGDAVVLSAELELAAWDVHGRKLWAAFVEPPWGYDVRGDRVHLDVMGAVSEFPLLTGPDSLPGRGG